MKSIIFIPCYNCAKQITRLLSKFSKELIDSVDEIIILENCDDEHTGEAALKFINEHEQLAKIKVARNHKNYGLGGSFKAAVSYCSENNFDQLVWLHGDDQAEPEDALKIINKFKKSSLDVIFGARFMKKSRLNNYSLEREIGNKVLNKIFSLALKKNIYELGSGLNAFRVQSLPLDEIPNWPNHIAFDANLIFHFTQDKYKLEFYPITWNETDQVSNAQNFSTAFTLLSMLMNYLFGNTPRCSDSSQDLSKYQFSFISSTEECQ